MDALVDSSRMIEEAIEQEFQYFLQKLEENDMSLEEWLSNTNRTIPPSRIRKLYEKHSELFDDTFADFKRVHVIKSGDIILCDCQNDLETKFLNYLLRVIPHVVTHSQFHRRALLGILEENSLIAMHYEIFTNGIEIEKVSKKVSKKVVSHKFPVTEAFLSIAILIFMIALVTAFLMI